MARKTNGDWHEQRPYKIYDGRLHMDLPWRRYATEERAIEKALVLVHWMEVGSVLTIYHDKTSTVVGEFRKDVSGIKYLE